MKGITKYITILLLCVGVRAFAQNENPYVCEIGLQGGIGYYTGDATPYIFMNPREAYGIQFRYKFNQRFALQVKASGQRIVGQTTAATTTTPFENRLYNFDVTGEFNFFRYGNEMEYDDRIKPYTPYIFIGIGSGFNMVDSMIIKGGKPAWSSIYIPFGIGFKWKFAKRWGLDIAWQHNIYFRDNIEGVPALDNPNGLNGGNIMNMDLTGMLTVGIVFEFGQLEEPCRLCKDSQVTKIKRRWRI